MRLRPKVNKGQDMNEIFLLVRAKKNKNIKTKPDICEYIAFTDNHLIALLWAYHGEYKKNTENFHGHSECSENQKKKKISKVWYLADVM